MQPQEIEVWYILPAVRKQLAEVFIRKHRLNQRKVAELLELRESTISQYIKKKRANEIVLDKRIKAEIEKSAGLILNNKKSLMAEIQRICSFAKKKGFLCKVHKKYEEIDDCGMCMR